MTINDIKFNYCTPRQYEEDGVMRYALPKTGVQMTTYSMPEIYKFTNNVSDKLGKVWIQMFDSGSRTATENINWDLWNGCVYIDVDSKHYYDEVKPFDTTKVLGALDSYFSSFHPENYMCMQQSNSGKGYHIFFYYNVTRNFDNYRKCIQMSRKAVYDGFRHIGGEKVCKYPKVMDKCTGSPYQGAYMTTQEMKYGVWVDNADEFGKCECIDEITLEDTIKINDPKRIKLRVDGKDTFRLVGKKNISGNDISYKPHHIRWCLYEALIQLFKDKDKVDEEWKYICEYLPENNDHKKSFYLNEPKRNRWYERYDDKVDHGITWLREFGYEIDIRNEYVYQEHFEQHWKMSCNHIAQKYWLDSDLTKNIVGQKVREMFGMWIQDNPKATKTEQNEVKKKMTAKVEENMVSEKIADRNIYDSVYDNLGKAHDSLGMESYDIDEKIERLRDEYGKSVFEKKDFGRIIGSYDKEKDATAYKMFCDIHYRDKDNCPTIKYNVLEDDIILTGGWDRANCRKQETTLVYNDEFTTWCNYNEYSNKMNRKLFEDSLNKYAPRWHSYNPIVDYLTVKLKDTPTDVEKMETFFIRHLGAPDIPVIRKETRNFFIAAVKEQLTDKPQLFVFLHMLLLQGATQNGKTYALTRLFTIDGKPYYSNDVKPDADDKTLGAIAAKQWMVQFGESASLKKVDNNTQKEFVDRLNMVFKFQKKFHNEMTTIYPRCVITRTTNEDTIFSDVSVNECDKRNWLIPCMNEAFSFNDKKKKEVDSEVDMVWATAVKLYMDDPDADLELTKEEYMELNELQKPYKLIKDDDMDELYDSLFGREYPLNEKGELPSASRYSEWIDMSEDNIFESSSFNHWGVVQKIPAKWLNEVCGGVSKAKLLKKKMERCGWKYKDMRYYGVNQKCWVSKDYKKDKALKDKYLEGII